MQPGSKEHEYDYGRVDPHRGEYSQPEVEGKKCPRCQHYLLLHEVVRAPVDTRGVELWCKTCLAAGGASHVAPCGAG